MSNEEYSDMDIQLELKDRLNYTYILQASLLAVKRNMFQSEIDVEDLENQLWDLFTDIPHDWYDKEFIDEVKASFIKKQMDVRPKWGTTPLSIKYCKDNNIPLTKTISNLNPFLLKNAIINLLHRRDMLVRKKKIEYSTGKNLRFDTVEQLDKEFTEDEMLETSEADKAILDEIQHLKKGIDEE